MNFNYCAAKDEWVKISQLNHDASALEDRISQSSPGKTYCSGDDGFCWQLDCPIQKILNS